jgi:UDP:flavonoid glycosyltransferase YjiC (YdhE family)
MTTVMIAAFGTRGDVAPYTGLARHLIECGYQVAIAAQEPYRALVTDTGVDFRPLPGDTEQATRNSPAAQAFVDGGRMRPSTRLLDEMRSDMRDLGVALADTAADADLLLLPAVAAVVGYHVAEGLGIPSAGVFLQPTAPTGNFPPSVLSARSFGRWGNRTLGRIGAVGEKAYLPVINELRVALGLTATSRTDYQRRRTADWPILHGFSPHIVPKPGDWPPHLHVTGYWWPQHPGGWQPPTRLTDFLQAGPPPVYIGLGSTATAHGAQLSEIIEDAVRRAGVRAVVQRGWAGLHCDSDEVITIGDVPHSWLLPQMSAAVHHCGAGTTAAALRAGIPSVPVTGIMDQPFWAARMHRLGVAALPMQRRSLNAESLSRSIRDVVTTGSYRARAQELSKQLDREDGAANAAAVITKLLDRSQEVHHGK